MTKKEAKINNVNFAPTTISQDLVKSIIEPYNEFKNEGQKNETVSCDFYTVFFQSIEELKDIIRLEKEFVKSHNANIKNVEIPIDHFRNLVSLWFNGKFIPDRVTIFKSAAVGPSMINDISSFPISFTYKGVLITISYVLNGEAQINLSKKINLLKKNG